MTPPRCRMCDDLGTLLEPRVLDDGIVYAVAWRCPGSEHSGCPVRLDDAGERQQWAAWREAKRAALELRTAGAAAGEVRDHLARLNASTVELRGWRAHYADLGPAVLSDGTRAPVVSHAAYTRVQAAVRIRRMDGGSLGPDGLYPLIVAALEGRPTVRDVIADLAVLGRGSAPEWGRYLGELLDRIEAGELGSDREAASTEPADLVLVA